MIFFSGLGFLVAPIIAASFVLGVILEGWINTKFGYQMPNGFFMAILTFVPFSAVLLLDKLLKRKGPIQRVSDKNGNIVEIPVTHTFMFFPLKWFAYAWAGLLIVVGVLVQVT